MQLAVCSVLRNEASKWLPSVLKAWESFADIIVALDDGSTDDTAAVLQACPKVEYHKRSAEQPMWGNEAPVRQELWTLGAASEAAWLLFLDGDMLPAADPRRLFETPTDAVAFKLYDLWQLHPPLYRMDGAWQAHNTARIWAVRNPGPAFVPHWNARGIHCGHLPGNLKCDRILIAPEEMSLLHLAYSDKEARKNKFEQYRSAAAIMSPDEQAHAASIADPMVQADLLPFGIQWPLSKANA